MNKIEKITIAEKALVRGDSNKRERERIITDLIKESNFEISEFTGLYSLHLDVIDNKLQFSISSAENNCIVQLPLTSLRRTIKDYHIICESYFNAVKDSDPRKIEAIDMGRRGIHNEGAELLAEMLEGKIKCDFETARKLFSLIYVIQIK